MPWSTNSCWTEGYTSSAVQAPPAATLVNVLSRRLSCIVSNGEPGAEPELGASDENLAATLRPIITKFIDDLDYTEPFVMRDPERFKAAVLDYARGTGVPCAAGSHSFSCLMVGYSTGNCFPDHPFEVRVWVAIYCWLLTITDDVKHGSTSLDDITRFQGRCMRGEPQPSKLTKALASHLQLAYEHYHPIVANLIVSRTYEFVTSTALAATKGFSRVIKNPSPGGQNFPWYIRDKDGVGEAFAWFTFPKATHPDPTVVIEAIHDMSKLICFINDVLSFYKEELAGDTDNYVHALANYSGTDVFTALRETAKEAIECNRRIESVLEGTGHYQKAWHKHGAGYLRLHLARKRYKLSHLGVGVDEPAKKERRQSSRMVGVLQNYLDMS